MKKSTILFIYFLKLQTKVNIKNVQENYTSLKLVTITENIAMYLHAMPICHNIVKHNLNKLNVFHSKVQSNYCIFSASVRSLLPHFFPFCYLLLWGKLPHNNKYLFFLKWGKSERKLQFKHILLSTIDKWIGQR